MNARDREERLWSLTQPLDELAWQLGRLPAGELKDSLLRLQVRLETEIAAVQLIPLAPLEKKIEAHASEVAEKLGRRVALELSGFSDLQVEPSVSDALQDILIHAIRNALDHGIESPDERRSKGKDELGRLHVEIRLEGALLRVNVRDDGAGLNVAALLAKRGVKAAVDALSHEDLQELFFAPGASSKAEATLVSGRGVGLSGIRRICRAAGGEVTLSPGPDSGALLEVFYPVRRVLLEAMPVPTPEGWVWSSELDDLSRPARQVLLHRVDSSVFPAGSRALATAGQLTGAFGVLAARALPESTDLAPWLDAERFRRLAGSGPRAACEAAPEA